MPVVGLIGAGIGLYQSLSADAKKKKEEKALQAQADGFQPNASLLDLYNKALAKYNPNPYQTASYGQQSNQINRNLATGLNAASNRRLGLGAIGGLVQQANDASARAAGNAEASNRQDLSQLAQASGMKTQEQQKKFDLMYNLTAAKAGAYAQTENTGLQNLYGGLSNAAYMYSSQDKSPWDNGINAGANAYKMPRAPRAF